MFLLVLPFGVYLRYYFKCSFFKKTVLASFYCHYFFELTQLSGLLFLFIHVRIAWRMSMI